MWPKILLFCIFLIRGNSDAFDLKDFSVDEALAILVPTVQSTNLKCRNDSILYLKELKNFKTWAIEMFDASSKIPSGVLFGSSYDFGNFDECVQVKVPISGEKIVGKYCMAEFHIASPNNENKYKYYDYETFFNGSAWEKMAAISNDRSRSSRNDFHFSYCIPSSCNHHDLEVALEKITKDISSLSDFNITGSVKAINCQQKDDFNFNTADLIFIITILIFFLGSLAATIYDRLMKLDDTEKYRLRGYKHEVIMTFSIWNNLKKLNEEGENKNLQFIHGVRVISTCLVILGHRLLFDVGSPMMNSSYVENLYLKVETTVLLNGPIIVDTFFTVSGFLTCYLLLVEFEKGKKINFVLIYLRRFIRLTPAYVVILAFYCTIFIKTGSGPVWMQKVGIEQERCISSWWTNLLYLNNYIKKDELCIFQSWYLSCDIHFFIISPILVWLLWKKPALGLGTLFTLIILSISIVFATVYQTKSDPILLVYINVLKDVVTNKTFQNIYIPTHMRASTYFIGMATGYIKYKIRISNYKMPKYMVYTGWLMCIFLLEVTVYTAFIFYLPWKPYDGLISAVYASMHHFIWGIGMSWMIIAISEGNGAWIEPILSWKPLTVLSKLSYTAFLCHGAIQIYTVATLRHPNYISIFGLVYKSAGDIVLAYFCGLLLSLFFEAPILRLEKVIFKRKDLRKDQKVNDSFIEKDRSKNIVLGRMMSL